ncbi:MAG: carbohydrate ABC transporter permease [Anaerolineae bacterium]|nr:carbohydrate ABC transporter permease [Anaerolineae bacterium]
MDERFGQRVGVVALHVVVISGALLTVAPIAFMIFSSFNTTTEIFTLPPWLPPAEWSFKNYETLLTKWPFPYWYINSIIYAGVVTVFVLFFCSLAGFAFAKYNFRAKNALFIILIGSTMIPFQLILIPLFILMSRIDWINHPASMIIPWMAPAFGIFLMRQYIQAVPSELMESARIHGASEFRIYARIIDPMVRTGLTTLAILTFLGSWNSYIWPLMVLRGNRVITLPVGIATMRSQATAAQVPYGEMMAAASMVSVPVILLFLMLQRYFISGLTIGAVKG